MGDAGSVDASSGNDSFGDAPHSDAFLGRGAFREWWEDATRRRAYRRRSRLSLIGLLLAAVGLFAMVAVAAALSIQNTFGPRSAGGRPTAAVAGATGAGSPIGDSASNQQDPNAQLAVAERAVLPWTDQFGVLHVQVIASLRNTSSQPIRIIPESISYSVDDGSGAEEMTGRFSVSVPGTIAPGRTAYVVDTTSVPFAEGRKLQHLTVQARGEWGAAPDRVLRVDGVAISRGPDGPEATGFVANQTSSPVNAVSVLVLLRDAHDHHPVGAIYDVADISGLGPGQRAPFRSGYPGAPPVPRNGQFVVQSIAAAGQ